MSPAPTLPSARHVAGLGIKQLFVRFLTLFIRSARQRPLPDDFRRILVIRQHDQLGDMLCAVPLLASLRQKFRSATITLVASPVNYAIMQNNPYVDSVLLYDKLAYYRSLPALARFIARLRSAKADLAIVPATVSVSVTSDLLSWISGARIRLGPASINGQQNPTSRWHTHPVDLDWRSEPRRHQSLRNIDIAAPLGLKIEGLECRIGFTGSELDSARKLTRPLREKYDVLVGIHPGAGKPANRWNADRFARVASILAKEHHAAIIIFAGPMDDIPLEQMKRHLTCTADIIRGRTIREVAAILDELDLAITNDTGVMHVAGGVRTHLLALFGPTDPLEWAPPGGKNRYLSSPDRNMNSISVEEVTAAAATILADASRN